MKLDTNLMIVVGGNCGSGKSTLVTGLKKNGYHAHSVAQEHSYAPKMYKMTKPDYVIMLSCQHDLVQQRRKVGWTKEHLAQQVHRLRHMRENCNLFIETDSLTIEQVLEKAVAGLQHYLQQGGKVDGCSIGRREEKRKG